MAVPVSDYNQLFEASYTRAIGEGVGVTEQGTAFFSRFYERLLQKSPEIAAMFRKTNWTGE